MNLRMLFAAILLVIQILPGGAKASFSFSDAKKEIASCFYVQANNPSSDLGGDCSTACKAGLPCPGCGVTCCAQSLVMSTHHLSHPFFETVRFTLDVDAHPAPDLDSITEPPRA